MALSPEEVKKIAFLARLSIKEENIEQYSPGNKEKQIAEPLENKELEEELQVDGKIAEDNNEKVEKKESTEVYEDYIGSLNEQIDFLKGQIDEKNRQLTSKDELILNFQYLLKEDRNRILLLENKMEDKKEDIKEEKKESFWKKIFNKTEA